MALPDLVGYPWEEAEAILRESGIKYSTERTRPTRDFFKTDESHLYIVRQQYMAGENLRLTLAAKLRKEVS